MFASHVCGAKNTLNKVTKIKNVTGIYNALYCILLLKANNNIKTYSYNRI